MGNKDDIIGSIMITDSIAENLKLTEEDLYAQAYENTPYKINDQFAAGIFIDKKPIRQNMTFAAPFKDSMQRMIPIFFGERGPSHSRFNTSESRSRFKQCFLQAFKSFLN